MGAISNRATGESFALQGSDMHPLEAASYLVQVSSPRLLLTP